MNIRQYTDELRWRCASCSYQTVQRENELYHSHKISVRILGNPAKIRFCHSVMQVKASPFEQARSRYRGTSRHSGAPSKRELPAGLYVTYHWADHRAHLHTMTANRKETLHFCRESNPGHSAHIHFSRYLRVLCAESVVMHHLGTFSVACHSTTRLSGSRVHISAWRRVFVLLLGPSSQVPRYCFKLGHDHFLIHPFQFGFH
jgi:hypothetical protein